MLTPYQFASNRPIDGLDIDGLEYLTYKVLIQNGKASIIDKIDHTKTMSKEDIQRAHNMTAEEFYKKNSKSYEEKGTGVLYEYYELDDKGNPQKVGEWMELKETIRNFGLYAGEGCVTYYGGNDKDNPYMEKLDPEFRGKYDFSNDPIDEVDGAAKKHDMDQESFDPPSTGHRTDPRTLPGDKEFVKDIEDYQDNAKKDGFKDKYTGRAQSNQARVNAWQAKFFFKHSEIPHKKKVIKKQDL